MPPIIPKYDTSLQEVCNTLATRWLQWSGEEPCPFYASDVADLLPSQMEEFCAILLEKTPILLANLKKMNEIYNINAIKNSEIKYRWLCVGLRSHWEEIIDDALEFAISQGRMKYCRPVFRDLFAWEKTRDKAYEVFTENQSKFMHVLVRNLKTDYKNTLKKPELS